MLKKHFIKKLIYTPIKNKVILLMTNIDTSFITDVMNHLLDYVPVLDNIIDRYNAVVNYYSYLFMGLLPFYLYTDPYFVVRNITHIYLALACSFYLYNKSTVWFLGVPITFVLDRIFKLPYDSIAYIMVFVVIATVAEFTYTLVHMINYGINNPQVNIFVYTLYVNREISQYVNEQTDERTEEQSEQQTDEHTEEQSEQQTDEPTEEPSEQPVDEPSEQPVNEPSEQSVNESSEQQTDEPSEQPVDEPSEQLEITPVDDDLSDLPELI